MDVETRQQLTKRLHAFRERLNHQLMAQSRLGYATPPYVLADITECRAEIRQIKAYLIQEGFAVEPQPGDEGPEGELVIPLDDISPGIELFSTNPGFSRFYRTAPLEASIAAATSPPTYHVFEAAMGYGKTALIGELWRSHGRGPGAVLAYIFSENHGRTRVIQAVRSLYQQIRVVATIPDGLAEENSFLSAQVLRIVSAQVSPLLLLLDGLDECGEAERSQLNRLLPDITLPGVTIVLTIRPTVADLLLRHIPKSHLLQSMHDAAVSAGARLHRLTPLSIDDIVGLLELFGHTDAQRLAEQIFDHSGGVPMSVISYVQQPELLHSAQPLVSYHERVLRYLHEQCPADQRVLLDRLLTLLAAAQSPLALDDLEELLAVPQDQIIELRGLLARHQHTTIAGELVLDHRLRDYLRTNERTSTAVRRASDLLADWVTDQISHDDLNAAPLYVLRHAAEYLALTSDLVALLCRPAWLNTIERRCRARSECTATIDRAMTRAKELFGDDRADIAVVNIIMCAIVRSSLGAMLAPELVARLVRLDLWSEREARDYARNYTSQMNAQALIRLLDCPNCPISLPAGSTAAEAEDSLEMVLALPPGMREAALITWQRAAEQMGDMASPGGNAGLIENLISALRQSPQQGGVRVPERQFRQLIIRLQSYTPPLSGAMSDPQFIEMVAEIADTWWQLAQRSLAPFWIHQIIGALAHLSRADLLETLELLAPAIRTIFPRSTPNLITALYQMAAA